MAMGVFKFIRIAMTSLKFVVLKKKFLKEEKNLSGTEILGVLSVDLFEFCEM